MLSLPSVIQQPLRAEKSLGITKAPAETISLPISSLPQGVCHLGRTHQPSRERNVQIYALPAGTDKHQEYRVIKQDHRVRVPAHLRPEHVDKLEQAAMFDQNTM
jgi:hypothetical protein